MDGYRRCWGGGAWNLFVEPLVRELVAHHLGVGLEELVQRRDADHLAADSLDLVELAMALEAELGIVVPEHVLDRVYTYGDLVQATAVLVRARGEAEVRAAEPPLRTRATRCALRGRKHPRAIGVAHSVRGRGHRRGRGGGAGQGAHLEVTVAASANDVQLARVQHQFARLGARDVRVMVRRNDRPVGTQTRDTLQTATPA